MSPQDFAIAFAGAFVGFTRDSGTRACKLADGSPQWMADAVREAHGGMLPDDWRYDAIRAIADELAGRDESEWDDAQGEICDALVDVYTSALTEWLASHLDRLGYCDQAQEDGLVSPEATQSQRLAAGQYVELSEIYASVVSSLRAVADQDGIDGEG